MANEPTDPQTDSPTQPKVATAQEKLLKVDADLIDAEDTAYKSGDQDIDTAGTGADDESPTGALGAGIEVPKSTD